MDDQESFYEGSRHVTELSPEDFLDYKDPSKKAWTLNPTKVHKFSAVLFYAPWCGHCKAFRETWESLYRINGCMKLYSFNCRKYADFYDSRLKISEAVRGFPTIMFYVGSTPVETYKGPRDPPDQLVKTMLVFCQLRERSPRGSNQAS